MRKLLQLFKPKASHAKRDAFVVYTPDVLLERHHETIEHIKSCTALERAEWEELYVQMINNVATYAQNLPASEAHHHSQIGGLLDHTLEIAMLAARISRGVLFTTQGNETQVGELSQVYVYAVVSAALLHDLGKLITDLDITFKSQKKEYPWSPVLGPMPVGAKYTFKMRKDRQRTARDHEHASALLVRSIVPVRGIRWIQEYDGDLFRMWLSTVTGHGQDYGMEVYECVHKADIESTKRAMNRGAGGQRAISTQLQDNSGQPTSDPSVPQPTAVGSRYFHEPFIDYWREQLITNSVPMNKAGAYAWVTDNHVFLIAPKAINQATEYLKDLNIIPAKKMTDGQVLKKLCEHNAVDCLDPNNPTYGMSTYEVIIPSNHEAKNDWKAKLMLAAVHRKLIDPELTLQPFKGILHHKDTNTVIYDGINYPVTPKSTSESVDNHSAVSNPQAQSNQNVEEQTSSSTEANNHSTPEFGQAGISVDEISSVASDVLSDLPGSIQHQGLATGYDEEYLRNMEQEFDTSDYPDPAEVYGQYSSGEVQPQSEARSAELTTTLHSQSRNNATPAQQQGDESVPLSKSIAKLTPKKAGGIDGLSSLLATPTNVDQPTTEDTVQSSDEKEGVVNTGKHFWWWLQEQSMSKKFQLNKNDAEIHILLGKGRRVAFMVSPVIFICYLKAHGLPSETNDIQALQRSFFKLQLHIPSGRGNLTRLSPKREKRGGKRPVSGVILSPEATEDLFLDQYANLQMTAKFEL